MCKYCSISALLMIALFVVSGCSSSIPKPKKGRDLHSMFDAHSHIETSDQTDGRQPVRPRDAPQNPHELHEYTRDVHNEVHNVFSWIPNPVLYLYVPPHVVGAEGLPITGYTIPFKMYEQNHFALPSEVPADD